MTQDALVVRLMPNNMAQVLVNRQTACGGNCGSCESCMYQSEVQTLAKNNIGAKVGERVIIASKSSRIFKAALLVYIMPVVLFLAGYAIAYSAGLAEGLRVLCSFAGLLAGAGLLVASQRVKKNRDPITFDIVGYAGAAEDV